MMYGLIAERIGHSFSAEIHKKLFGYDYELKAISKAELDFFMRDREFKAINVTIPYKEAVIPYIDHVDETAKSIGAVNTIVNVDGVLYGYNTDVMGLTALINKNGIEIKNKKVLVLGSGGTSKTALYTAKTLGASEIFRVSRSGRDGCVTYDLALNKHNDAEIIINTTPSGMYPDIYESAVDVRQFPELQGVIDVVYNPLNSKLVCDAKKMGVKACGGLYMLVAQAAYAAEKFVGKSVDKSRIDEIFSEIYAEKSNIVLIGMPGSGKTACGRHLAEMLGKTLIDTDDVITEKIGKTPNEIITESGESKFREIESAVVKEVSAMQGAVISTGGGTILNYVNLELLRENGRVYFLDRALDDIKTSDDRPLSKNRELLEKRYNERYSIYCDSCDKRIVCVDGAELNARQILEDLLNENSCYKRT